MKTVPPVPIFVSPMKVETPVTFNCPVVVVPTILTPKLPVSNTLVAPCFNVTLELAVGPETYICS